MFGHRGDGMYQDYILEDLEDHIAKRVRRLEEVIASRQQVEAWISAILTICALLSVGAVYMRMKRYLGKGFNFGGSAAASSMGGD